MTICHSDAMTTADKMGMELMRLQTEMRELERLTNARMDRMRKRIEKMQEALKESNKQLKLFE